MFNGQEIWVGNDDYETDDNAVYQGRLSELRGAFEDSPPHLGMPAGSQGMLISYSTGIDVLVPMGPIERLTAASFHDQKHYRGRIGTDLVLAYTRAFDELRHIRAGRKVLLIFGDGYDTNNEVAVPIFERGRAEALQRNIEIINIGPPNTCTGRHMREELVTRTVIAGGERQGIADALAQIWR